MSEALRKQCKLLVIVALLGLFSSCQSLVVSDQAPQLVVSEPKLVQHCVYLGTVDKTIQEESIFGHWSGYEARQEVLTRAVRLGATHVVWLHTSPGGAMAQAYACPAADPPPPSDTEALPANPTAPESASTDIPADNQPPFRERSPGLRPSTTP